MKKIKVTELRSAAKTLRAGDEILLSGTIYTARDAAHKRFFALLDQGKPLPFDIKDAVIYYAGPTPAKNGMAVGSCGPTTSSRMDPYAPGLLDLGLVGMIGKGDRNQGVYDALVRNGGIYLCAIGGAGALAASCIKSVEVIAFEELGCESVKRMVIEDFPLFVGIDSTGKSLFQKEKS
ncbi:MAG: FumA C-terminus/TtdB family hydratase beta subunit [Eubacteriales bacterium]